MENYRIYLLYDVINDPRTKNIIDIATFSLQGFTGIACTSWYSKEMQWAHNSYDSPSSSTFKVLLVAVIMVMKDEIHQNKRL